MDKLEKMAWLIYDEWQYQFRNGDSYIAWKGLSSTAKRKWMQIAEASLHY